MIMNNQLYLVKDQRAVFPLYDSHQHFSSLICWPYHHWLWKPYFLFKFHIVKSINTAIDWTKKKRNETKRKGINSIDLLFICMSIKQDFSWWIQGCIFHFFHSHVRFDCSEITIKEQFVLLQSPCICNWFPIISLRVISSQNDTVL